MESLHQLTDNAAYENQKRMVQRAINTDVSNGGDVYILSIDYDAFRKDEEEKKKAYSVRKAWREEMRKKWGPTWTKHGASRSFGEFGHRMN